MSKEQNRIIVYIVVIITGFSVFISIFYIKMALLLSVLALFFILSIIIQKSLNKAIKKFLYILPYFLGVLILQSITPRGEFYSVLNIKLDKTGVDFTILYFIRLITLLYFLQVFFFVMKRLPPPDNKIYNELFRVAIFMKIVRKSFFRELVIIKKANGNFVSKLSLMLGLIDNVYKTSFKNYPYDSYILRFRR